MKRAPIWFWQRMVTPHQAELAAALARLGHPVTYVAEELLSAERAAQGWTLPPLPGVQRVVAADAQAMAHQADSAPPEAVHLCQGVRGNGLVAVAQRRLLRQGRRVWAVMEAVDDEGWRGLIKRTLYRGLFARHRALSGVLAIGLQTPDWVIARGVEAAKVFPFAYFLPDVSPTAAPRPPGPFRLLFVGQLIARKRLDLLLEALSSWDDGRVELVVVGGGPLAPMLRVRAEAQLGARCHWRGLLSMEAVGAEMARADALVLPSRHDGWGAVISEALLVGTPVVCSDSCGAAGVAWMSGEGAVFRHDDPSDLSAKLQRLVAVGPIGAARRRRLAHWARCLGAEAGAAYLTAILRHAERHEARPLPPWGALCASAVAPLREVG